MKRRGWRPEGKEGAVSVKERRSRDVEVKMIGLHKFNRVPEEPPDDKVRREGKIREMSDQWVPV